MGEKVKLEPVALRLKAEEIMSSMGIHSELPLSEAETLRLLHELQVHQVELELQNEELVLAKEQAEATSQKYIELYEALEVSEQRHRLLSETMLQGLVHQDAEGRIISMNPAAERILGKNIKRFFGNSSVEDEHKPIREDGTLFPDEEHPAMITLRSGMALQNVVMGMFNPSMNETRWICIDSVPLFRTGEKMPYEVYTIFEDITERKLSEGIINYHAGLIENISDAIVSTDEHFRIKSWNSGAENMYGWKKEEVMGKSFSEILQTEFPDNSKHEEFVHLLHTSSGWRGDVIQKHKDNTSIHILSSVKKLHDKYGNFSGSVCVNRDITELKKAEKALLASEEKFRKLVNDMEVGVLLNSSQSGILLCNPKGQELLGVPENQLLGKTPFDPQWQAIQEDKSPFPGELHPASQVIATGKPVKNVVMGVYQPLKGDYIWLLINAQPQLNDNGTVNQVITTFIDITQQVKTEEALRVSEFFFRESQQAGFIGSYKVDLKTGLWESSEVHNQIYGINKAYTRNLEGWLNLVHPDDRQMLSQHLWEEAIKNGVPFNKEYRIIRQDNGKMRWVHDMAKVRFDANNKAELLVGTLQDITSRKEKEEKLRKLNQTLTVLSKSSQAMSHSVNETDYLEEVCKIIVEDTDFVMVWMGYAEEDEAKTIRPVASAGFNDNYLQTIQFSWADNEFGRGPTGTAIRTGTMCKCNNILTDPTFKPWREQALQRGFASAIVFPLKSGDKTFGALTIYSHQPDSFLEDEIKTLSKLANDLAHGITTIRLKAAHQKAKQALVESYAELEELVKLRTAELAKTNEALKLTEDKYRTVADFATNWEFWISPSDRMIYCSPSCEQITGYTATEFLMDSKLIQNIIHPEDLPLYLEHKEAEKLGNIFASEIQYRIYRKDGIISWIGHFCKPIFDESHNFRGIRGSNKDITAGKSTEELLKTSNRKYSLLSANITDGIFIYKNGAFEYVNSAMSHIFGYPEQEFIGMNLMQLVKPEELDKLDFLNYLNSPVNQIHNVEFECLRYDQSTVYVEFLFNFVASESEIYGVVHDITEKKQLQTNIVKAIILTEEKERAHFSKELHDGLGPLLSTIKLYLQWSERPKTNTSREEIIRKAEDILEEALTTVKEISNKISPHLLTNYGLTSAIQNFVSKLAETSAIGIVFESNVSRRLDKEIEASFYRAVIECINNSLKHAAASSIHITLNDTGSQLTLQYRDNGIGFIIEEALSLKKGFGLYNLQNRIETIGGKINMSSSLGGGVDFQIAVNL